MWKCKHFGYSGLNILLKLISPVPFYFLDVATRKFKTINTYVAHIIFILDSVGVDNYFNNFTVKGTKKLEGK